MATDGVYESIGPTGEEAPTQGGIELTRRQQAVCRELVKLDGASDSQPASVSLHDMYLGAVVVLKHSANPDRFAQAAHSLREVIEKFAERRGGPLKAGASSTNRVSALQASWNKCDLPDDSAEAGGVKLCWPKIRGFLNDARAFFQWFNPKPPSRREQLGAALGQVVPSGERLPGSIERRETDRWFKVRDDVTDLAHHRRSLTEPDVRILVEHVEALILEPVFLRTFERFDQIDRIVAQGEGEA